MSKILGRNIPLKSYSLTNDKSLRIKQNNNIIKISEFKSQPVIKKRYPIPFNNNNNNLFYSKHISPPSNKKSHIPPLLIENNFHKKVSNTQKKEKRININNNTNSYTYSQKKFYPQQSKSLLIKKNPKLNILIK